MGLAKDKKIKKEWNSIEIGRGDIKNRKKEKRKINNNNNKKRREGINFDLLGQRWYFLGQR